MLKTTIQNLLHKFLRLYAYKIQMRHKIKEINGPKCIEFAVKMLKEIDDDDSYLNRIFF